MRDTDPTHYETDCFCGERCLCIDSDYPEEEDTLETPWPTEAEVAAQYKAEYLEECAAEQQIEAERLSRLCAQKAEECHHWATLAWREKDMTEARACSTQEIAWRRDQMAWAKLARLSGLPTPAPVQPVTPTRPAPLNERQARLHRAAQAAWASTQNTPRYPEHE